MIAQLDRKYLPNTQIPAITSYIWHIFPFSIPIATTYLNKYLLISQLKNQKEKSSIS